MREISALSTCRPKGSPLIPPVTRTQSFTWARLAGLTLRRSRLL